MFSFSVLLPEHTENHADGPTQWWTPPTTPNPTTSRDAYRSAVASIVQPRSITQATILRRPNGVNDAFGCWLLT